MKKIFGFGVVVAMFALQSCEEKGVVIDFGDKRDVFDTTYLAAVEVPQLRNVFIEEFTGASCTNCPAGHVDLANIISTYPDRIVAVAYHTFNGGNIFKPVNKVGEKSAYDFRDTAATNIGNTIFGGVGSIPIAGIDRTFATSTSRLYSRSDWPSKAANRVGAGSGANMYLTSAYDAAKNEVTLKVKVAYTVAIAKKNALTIGVIESGIIDLQEFTDSVAEHYVHNHIFRKCLTTYYGNAVLDSISTKTAGRVYEYNYKFTPTVGWNLDNCEIVAVLSNNESDDKEVLQAKEVNLK